MKLAVFFSALPCLAQSLIISNVTLIDATGAPPRNHVSVSISGGRITAIRNKIRPPRGAEVVDGTGKFLIPGLWDMHVHIVTPEVFFPLMVANGITGVRDMFSGVPPETIRQWRIRGDIPRIVTPGFLDGPLLLTAGPPPPGAFAVATPEQARFAVRALAQSGVDFLKVYNSLSREAYFAIAEEAHLAGLPFVGHVPEAVSVAEASEAGQRSQEHLINVLLACSTREEELRAERIATMTSQQLSGEARLRLLAFPVPEGLFDTYSDEKAAKLFATFAKNNTWHTPTLALLSGFAHARDDDFLHDPRRRYLPKAWTDAWDPSNTFFLRDLSAADYDALNARIRALLARHQKLVGVMHRAGVEFLAGTDTNTWTPLLPGFALHDELQLLVASGLSPMEAIQTATRNPARYFGTLDQTGTVQKGKTADLVLLNANPLEDIRNTRKIEAVVMRGRYFSRKELDGMLRLRQ